MNRIFIMSSERSGSNLLRKMLGNTPGVVAPPAIHHTTNLAPLSSYYKNGQSDYKMDELVSDMISLSKAHILPWKDNINQAAILSRIQYNNFWGAYVALYDELAFYNFKDSWVCKDNALFDYAPELIYFFPDCRFIYLVRDGRDVALSFLSAPAGPKTITAAARLWLKEQQKCLRLLDQYPDNILLIKYEDLIENTENIFHQICNFTNLPFSNDFFLFHKANNTEPRTSPFWANLNKPVIKNNTNKWIVNMSDARQTYYTNFANGEMKATLKRLNYKVLDRNRNNINNAVFRVLDHLKNYYTYIGRLIFRPEGKLRASKKKVLMEIKSRLSL